MLLVVGMALVIPSRGLAATPAPITGCPALTHAVDDPAHGVLRAGESITCHLQLTAAPPEPGTVTVSFSSLFDRLTYSPSTISFDSMSWGTAQDVTITAAADEHLNPPREPIAIIATFAGGGYEEVATHDEDLLEQSMYQHGYDTLPAFGISDRDLYRIGVVDIVNPIVSRFEVVASSGHSLRPRAPVVLWVRPSHAIRTNIWIEPFASTPFDAIAPSYAPEFTPLNWMIPQPVFVTMADDGLRHHPRTRVRIEGRIVSDKSDVAADQHEDLVFASYDDSDYNYTSAIEKRYRLQPVYKHALTVSSRRRPVLGLPKGGVWCRAQLQAPRQSKLVGGCSIRGDRDYTDSKKNGLTVYGHRITIYIRSNRGRWRKLGDNPLQYTPPRPGPYGFPAHYWRTGFHFRHIPRSTLMARLVIHGRKGQRPSVSVIYLRAPTAPLG